MLSLLSSADPKKLKGIALLRLDFNTNDDWRLRSALPTLRRLSRHAKSIVIVSHKGRPERQEAKLSLRSEGRALSKLLKRKVIFIPNFRFAEIQKTVREAPRGSVFLLENIRFLSGEAANDPKLGRSLASLADYFVNDAFAVCHRSAASVVAVTRFLPAYAGLGLEKEIVHLSRIIKKPEHPFVVVVGGAKAADKIDVLWNLARKADYFLTGGGSANTVLMLRGKDIGASIYDRDAGDIKRLRTFIKKKNVIAPADWLTGKGRILDIGPGAARAYAKKISSARTILWSGPMGYIEDKRFAGGTLAVARAIAANRRAFSVTGGGETVSFLKQKKLDKKFSFISTGGGAMLEFLSGRKLPGIEALK